MRIVLLILAYQQKFSSSTARRFDGSTEAIFDLTNDLTKDSDFQPTVTTLHSVGQQYRYHGSAGGKTLWFAISEMNVSNLEYR